MNIKKIEEVCLGYKNKVTGSLCIGVTDLQTGETYTLNGDKQYPTASTCKVYTLAALYKMVAEGKADDNERLELTDEYFVRGSGVLFRMLPGLKPTLYDYAMLMMILSDNIAADVLYYYVGGAEGIKKEVLEPLGLKNTKFDLSIKQMFPPCFNEYTVIETNGHKRYSYYKNSGYMCVNEKDDVTTINDLMKVFKLIYRKELYSPEVCEKMLHIMKCVQTNTRIPKFLPPNTEVAHKTGTLDCLCNDAGIVYTKKGDYLIAMSYNGNDGDFEEYKNNDRARFSDNLLAEISRDIYKVYMED